MGAFGVFECEHCAALVDDDADHKCSRRDLLAEIERLREENEKYSAGMQENCALRAEIDRLRARDDLFVEAMAEIKATDDGDSPQPVKVILDHLIAALRGEVHASECVNPSGSTGDGRTNWDRPKAALRGEVSDAPPPEQDAPEDR